MAQRIMNPKMKKDNSNDTLHKFYQQKQSDSRVRRRFSNRSQNVMQTIALDSMKLEKKYLQFLPQIGRRPLDPARSRSKTKK